MQFVIALAIAVALVLWFGRRARPGGPGRLRKPVKKPCQWDKVGDPAPGGVLREYHCQTCKVTAYSSTGQPPVQCKRNLDGTL